MPRDTARSPSENSFHPYDSVCKAVLFFTAGTGGRRKSWNILNAQLSAAELGHRQVGGPSAAEPTATAGDSPTEGLRAQDEPEFLRIIFTAAQDAC